MVMTLLPGPQLQLQGPQLQYQKGIWLYARTTAAISRTQLLLQEHSCYFKNTAATSRTQLLLQEHSCYFKNTAATSRAQSQYRTMVCCFCQGHSCRCQGPGLLLKRPEMCLSKLQNKERQLIRQRVFSERDGSHILSPDGSSDRILVE